MSTEKVVPASGMSSGLLGGLADVEVPLWGFLSLHSALLMQIGKDTDSVVGDILPLTIRFNAAAVATICEHLCVHKAGRSLLCVNRGEMVRISITLPSIHQNACQLHCQCELPVA